RPAKQPGVLDGTPPARAGGVRFLTPTFALAVIVGSAVWSGCSSSQGDTSADEAFSGSTECTVFNNQTGKAITADELKRLGAPIAVKWLAGACANTYSEALTKMTKTDSARCDGSKGSDAKTGLGTYFVSETAAFSSGKDAAKDGFRTIIT